MKIDNVHERVVDAKPADVALLLETLGQPDDRLYPPLWEPMRLDGPLAVGTSGTHGTITAYAPGRLIEFTFPDGLGVTGTHTFTVTPLGQDRCLVRHEVDAEAHPVAWLFWKLVIEPSHDPVLEQLLDRLQAAVAAPPAHSTVLSAYSRLLRWFERPRARTVADPPSGLIVNALPRADDSDVFVIERRRETPDDPEDWVEAIFRDVPRWIDVLMTGRERLVGLVGIERDEPGEFVVIDRTVDEVLLGTDSSSLNHRIAVRCEPQRVVMSGAVQITDRRGRAYYCRAVRRLRAILARLVLNLAAHRLAQEGARAEPLSVHSRAVMPAERKRSG